MKKSRRQRFAPHSDRRTWWLLGSVLGVLVLAAVLRPLWKSQPEPPATAIGPAESLALPPAKESAQSAALRAARYVGSEACAKCHADQHASYLETAHARSFAAVDLAAEPADGEFAGPRQIVTYRSFRARGELRHCEVLPTAEGEQVLADRPLAWLVGSGRFSRTYLAEVDGFLVESPLTWFASLNNWRLSPGLEAGVHGKFCRNVGADCLYCHVGRAETIGQSEYKLRIHERAIGCERCHGPGSLHVAAREQSATTPPADDLTIVHPKKLSRELSEAICHQCHLETVTHAVVRGRRREDFRPGHSWTDFVVNYAFAGTSDMTVTGHVQQMQASRCYRESDSLTCVTCHDPHEAGALPKTERNRAACLNCHADEACSLPRLARVDRNRNDCAACHMPQTATDIPHIAFTHHRIGIHAERPSPPQQPRELGALLPVLDISHLPAAEQNRLLGLATMRLIADYPEDSRYRQLSAAAEMQLRDAIAGGGGDAAIESTLASVAGERGDADQAACRARRALAAGGDLPPRERAAATYLLAGLALRAGQLAEARQHLENLVAWRLEPGDWFLLAACRARQGDAAGAIAAYEKVLVIDPSEPSTYRALIPLYEAAGDSTRSGEARRMLNLLEERLGSTASQGP